MQSKNKKKFTQEKVSEALKKKIVVWLDDLRDPKDYGHPDALWFKSFSELKNTALPQGTILLKNFLFTSRIEVVHLDHDLGNDSDGTGYVIIY